EFIHKVNGKRGIELTISDIEWRNPYRVNVKATYHQDRYFNLTHIYSLRRTGDTWKLIGERTEEQDHTDACVLRGHFGSHRYRIDLAYRPFLPRDHTLKLTRNGDGSDYEGYLVDGREPYGTMGQLPELELSRLEVRVDGKRWPIPVRLWRDCYQLH